MRSNSVPHNPWDDRELLEAVREAFEHFRTADDRGRGVRRPPRKSPSALVTCMVLSGYANVDAITRTINNGAVSKFLLKPWDDEELRSTIRDAFARVFADEARV